MRQLRDDTHLILDGEVRVYRREQNRYMQNIWPPYPFDQQRSRTHQNT